MSTRAPDELSSETPLVTVAAKADERFLRRKTAAFDPTAYPRKVRYAMVRSMRKIMREHQGIGLSANQVGMDLNFCVVEPPREDGSTALTVGGSTSSTAGGKKRAFYALGNPAIVTRSAETGEDEEGCLSVPETYGAVSRHERVTVEGVDIHGRRVRVRARGLLARIFQHEIDHLSGVLFVDKAKEVHKAERQAE